MKVIYQFWMGDYGKERFSISKNQEQLDLTLGELKDKEEDEDGVIPNGEPGEALVLDDNLMELVENDTIFIDLESDEYFNGISLEG